MVMDACMYYANKTGRRVTFEYALIAGENDSLSTAYEVIPSMPLLLYLKGSRS